MNRVLLASIACLTGSLAAQSTNCFYVPNNTPSTGSCNVIPFGTNRSSATWRNQRYQMIIPAAKTKVGRIVEIAFSPCGSGIRSFDSITIKMNNTKLTDFKTGPNLNFVANLGTNPTTVLDAKNYVWHNTANRWNRIGLQTPFLQIPTRGGVIVDILLKGAHFTGSNGFRRASNVPRLYAFSWPTNPPTNGSTETGATQAGLKLELCYDTHDLSLFGESCGSAKHTLTGSAQAGKTVDFNLSGGPTSPPIALFMLGTSNATPYPVVFPGTKCSLYQNYNVAILGLPTRSGAFTLKVPMPKLPGLKLYSQWLVFPGGKIESTNYGRVLIGS